MIIPFHQLSASSKVWIYAANRTFTPEEENIIAKKMEHFLKNWQDKEEIITGGFELALQQFIIVATSGEQHVDGCALDQLLRLIKEIEQQLNISMLNRTNIYYKQNNNLTQLPLLAFKEGLQKGSISPEVTIIDTTISTLEQYRNGWEKAAKESWLSRYL